jgi:hypothetical protein
MALVERIVSSWAVMGFCEAIGEGEVESEEGCSGEYQDEGKILKVVFFIDRRLDNATRRGVDVTLTTAQR